MQDPNLAGVRDGYRKKRQMRLIMKNNWLFILWWIVHLLYIFSCQSDFKKTQTQKLVVDTMKTNNFEQMNALDKQYLNPIKSEIGRVYGGSGGLNFEFYLDKDGKIKTLYISNFGIKKVIPIILNLHNLEFLIIKSNSMYDIPDFSPLKKLNTLILHSDNFRDTIYMPKNYKPLRALVLTKVKNIIFRDSCVIKSLGLSGNDIEKINPSFNMLKNLEWLSIMDNKIKEIDLSSLKKLKEIYLVGNPIKDTNLVKKIHQNTKVYFKYPD
jgi:Leucine-rich repeat (LRR) protein